MKGTPVRLIHEGRVLEEGLHEASITREDLKQALRLHDGQDDPSNIRVAHMERNGKISIVLYRRDPRVVDVAVEKGVQTRPDRSWMKGRSGRRSDDRHRS